MEIEKKLNVFNSQLNSLKDKSVLKKSKEQRREIFLELKRQEEERLNKQKVQNPQFIFMELLLIFYLIL